MIKQKKSSDIMVSQDSKEKMEKISSIDRTLQQFLMQKQQLQAQLLEIDSALSELGKTNNAYKIVGNIMVSSSKEDLVQDLQKKKELVEIKIKSVEKQESRAQEMLSDMQKEIMPGAKNE